MRSILIAGVIILCFAFLFFIGCATFEKTDLEVLDNAALVAAYCNKEIDMSDFQGIGHALSKMAQSEDFNLEPSAIKIKNDVLEVYATYFPFKFIDEETVKNNAAYKDLYDQGADWLKTMFFSTASGYQVVRHTNRDTIDILFAAFPEADALMFTSADFKLSKESQVLRFGTARVQAFHNIVLVNRDKNIILSKQNYAVSRHSIKFALGGVFDTDKIQLLCTEALSKAAEATERWIVEEMGG
jgi:hypothetical protein